MGLFDNNKKLKKLNFKFSKETIEKLKRFKFKITKGDEEEKYKVKTPDMHKVIGEE